jgi:AraC-like DNA-binding protein
VEPALRVVEERFRSPLTLSKVARTLSVTPGHLTETVRRRTGRPLGHWILERRMEEARSLLGGTTLTVSAISGQCGFSELNHFSRQFRRHHGISPQAWRRALSARGNGGHAANDP